MDGGSTGRAAGLLDGTHSHTSDAPSASSRLRPRAFFSAPMPSFDARSSNNDLALAVAALAVAAAAAPPAPRLISDPSSSAANHRRQTTGTGFSSNTVISSSSSGTIVSSLSTTNTSRSSGSSPHLYYFDDDDGTHTRQETDKKLLNNIKSLVQEFFGVSSSSATCTVNGGDMSVLERWFAELGVDWVLHISDDDASVAGTQPEPDRTFDPRSWIRALNEIVETIRLTTSFFSGRVGMPSIYEGKEEEDGDDDNNEDYYYEEEGEEDDDNDGDDDDGDNEEEEEKEKKKEAEGFFQESVKGLSNYIIGRGKNRIQREQEEGMEAETCIPDQLQFARFIQETMLKMLIFVDFLVALDPNTACELSTVAGGSGLFVAPALYQKTSLLLRVLDALSDALFEIEVLLLSTPPSEEVTRVRGEMLSLLYATDNKATEAVRSTTKEIWARIMETKDGQDSVTTTTHGSSDIHRVTLAVTSHIRYLWAHHWSVTSILFSLGNGAGAAGHASTGHPLAILTTEMVSCLEERLARRSRSFADQGLGYLFLINNSSYVLQQLQATDGSGFLHSHIAALDRKVEDYVHAYLQLCWAPVLSCLLNATPRCFGKGYSPLPKFESEFQRIYATQKLWNVPDPGLRKKLRGAVTTKIIPGYTRYVEDNKASATNFTPPQDLGEMLQELFEG